MEIKISIKLNRAIEIVEKFLEKYYQPKQIEINWNNLMTEAGSPEATETKQYRVLIDGFRGMPVGDTLVTSPYNQYIIDGLEQGAIEEVIE